MNKEIEIVKFTNGELSLDVNVSLHINNILNDNELDYSTVKEILTVRQ